MVVARRAVALSEVAVVVPRHGRERGLQGVVERVAHPGRRLGFGSLHSRQSRTPGKAPLLNSESIHIHSGTGRRDRRLRINGAFRAVRLRGQRRKKMQMSGKANCS
jgi:hypothetical protein